MIKVPSKLYNLCSELKEGNKSTEESITNIQQWLTKNKKKKYLLQNSANYKCKCNLTPLHLLAAAHAPPDLVAYILQLGKDTIRLKANDGRLPLHCACLKPCPIIISILLHAYPEAARERDENGDLPLHLACSYKAGPEIVRMLIEANLMGPEVQNYYGKLPLHFACGNNAHPEIVGMLLDVYKKGAAIQDNLGKLPLLWACRYGVSIEVLDLLVSAFPEGVDIKDGGSKRRPSEWLKEGAKCNYGNNYKFLLHKAAAGRFSRQLVKLLLQAFPESIKEFDRNGLTPLHYACLKQPADISIDVVLSLLAAYPSAFTMPNPSGKSPHDLIMEATCKKDEKGMVLLHHVAGCTKDLSVNALDFLVHINPDSVLLPDRNQMLPFHHACLNSTSSLDVIMRFIQLYPEGIFSCKLLFLHRSEC